MENREKINRKKNKDLSEWNKISRLKKTPVMYDRFVVASEKKRRNEKKNSSGRPTSDPSVSRQIVYFLGHPMWQNGQRGREKLPVTVTQYHEEREDFCDKKARTAANARWNIIPFASYRPPTSHSTSFCGTFLFIYDRYRLNGVYIVAPSIADWMEGRRIAFRTWTHAR